MIKDRRTGKDRRAVRRYEVSINVEWEGLIGRQQGAISDLSMYGCFVLCTGEVEDGETIKVFIPLADNMKVQFIGQVVNHVFEIGFGLKFFKLSDGQRELLKKLIKSIGAK